MQILIDCYGHPATSERFQKADFAKKVYRSVTDGNKIYQCFSGGTKRPIHRIVTNGNEIEITWAFGSWENRAQLSYTATLNDPIPVDESEME